MTLNKQQQPSKLRHLCVSVTSPGCEQKALETCLVNIFFSKYLNYFKVIYCIPLPQMGCMLIPYTKTVLSLVFNEK